MSDEATVQVKSVARSPGRGLPRRAPPRIAWSVSGSAGRGL